MNSMQFTLQRVEADIAAVIAAPPLVETVVPWLETIERDGEGGWSAGGSTT